MKKKNRLTKNLGLKVLAVFFSFIMWIVAVNINDPVEKKIFRNVKVECQNTGILTDKGKVWQVIEDTDTVTVTVRASRSVLETINESDITAIADFTELSYTNTVPIKLSMNKYIDKRVEDLTSSIESVKLNVEDLKKKQLLIEVETSGKPADGYMAGGSTLTNGNSVRISGPESVVDQVTKAVVEVDLSGYSSNIDISLSIKLLDKEGKEIKDTGISKSVNSAQVFVPMLKVKQVPLKYSVQGETAEGYRLTGEISSAPDTVTIAGKSSVINEIEELQIPSGELDVTGAAENVTVLVDIRSYLPDGVVLADEDFNGKATVTVRIEPLIDAVKEVAAGRVQIANIPAGYTAVLASQNPLKLALRGLQGNLDQVNVEELTGYLDVTAALKNTGLDPAADGTYPAEVGFQLPEGVSQTAAVVVQITVTKIPDPDQEQQQE